MENQNSERSLEALRMLQKIYSGISSDTEQSLSSLLSLGARHLGMGDGMIVHLDGKVGVVMHHSPHASIFYNGYVIPEKDMVLPMDRSVSVSSFKNKSYLKNEFVNKTGIECLIKAPVTIGGVLYGGICFVGYTSRTEDFDEIDILLVTHLSSIVSLIIEKSILLDEMNAKEYSINDIIKKKDAGMVRLDHEFRTPLNAIMGFADLLKEELKGKQGEILAENIADASRNLLHIINTVKGVAIPEIPDTIDAEGRDWTKSLSMTDLSKHTIKFDKGRVLVVDDARSNRFFLMELLRRSGLDTMEASNGEEAIEMIRNEKPDAVILDIFMPVLDGQTLARILRDDPIAPQPPLIALTGSDLKGVDRSLFDAVLNKPIRRKKLLETLSRFLTVKSEMSESPEKNSGKRKSFSLSEISVSSEIYETVHYEYRDWWDRVSGSLSLEDIGQFASAISSFGLEHRLEILNEYGSSLSASVDKLDIAGIQINLKQFPMILDKIKFIE